MHERHDVHRLDIVDVKHVVRAVRRLDLIGLPVFAQEGFARRVKARVLVAKLDGKRLIGRERERDEATLLRILRRVHVRRTRSNRRRALRKHEEVAALRQTLLVLLIVKSPVHGGGELARRKRHLNFADTHAYLLTIHEGVKQTCLRC